MKVFLNLLLWLGFFYCFLAVVLIAMTGNTPDTSTVMVPNASTEFHVYSIDWSVAAIKFYVDNQIFYTFTNTASFPFNQIFP